MSRKDIGKEKVASSNLKISIVGEKIFWDNEV